MTDQPGEHRRPDDEVVAAVLDDEATPEERARVEADPVLSARLEEFAAVRDLVARPVDPPIEADRERAIAAAKVAVRHQPTVVPLAERRRQELPRFLAVAAAVLLVLLAAGFLVSKVGGDDSGDYAGSGSGDDSAATAEADAEPEASTADDAGDATADSGGEGSFAGVERIDDLGAVADDDQLLAALDDDSAVVTQSTRSVESSGTASDEPELSLAVAGDSEACQAGLDEGDPGLSGLLVQTTADFAGTPATVYVFATAAGGQRVIAVTTDGCRVLTAFDL